MATQTFTQTQHDRAATLGRSQNPPNNSDSARPGALGTLDALIDNNSRWAMGKLDGFFPPEQRDDLLAKANDFVAASPKLSAFFCVNVALSGIPLALFTLFALWTTTFSILGGITLGLLGGVLLTFTAIGLALTIVLPILIFTTASACFLFLVGLAGYQIVQRTSSDRSDTADTHSVQQGAPPAGKALNLPPLKSLDELDSPPQRQPSPVPGY